MKIPDVLLPSGEKSHDPHLTPAAPREDAGPRLWRAGGLEVVSPHLMDVGAFTSIGGSVDRFRKIVERKVKGSLKDYIKDESIIVRRGNGKVAVPIPHIDIPRLRFDPKQGGVGQGEGEGDGDGEGDEDGPGKAGDGAGEHALEEVGFSQLLEWMGEQLHLPRIQPKGKDSLEMQRERYNTIRKVGPDALRHFKRTYKQALKREIGAQEFDPRRGVVPIREDMRFKAGKPKPLPTANAVAVLIMDVSGSMGDEQKALVRTISFWIEAWLRHNYQVRDKESGELGQVDVVHIIHDAVAKQVTRDVFFQTKESGGTKISSAYQELIEVMKNYPPQEWNIYPFQFSDGDNFSADDTALCHGLLREHILPHVNQFCYGQVESPYGSGQFKGDLEALTAAHSEVLNLADIKDRDAIPAAIQKFLGRGK